MPEKIQACQDLNLDLCDPGWSWYNQLRCSKREPALTPNKKFEVMPFLDNFFLLLFYSFDFLFIYFILF